MADLKVEITVNDTMQAIMNNDLVDIKTWIEDAVVGKAEQLLETYAD